jgi:hypothetical protein
MKATRQVKLINITLSHGAMPHAIALRPFGAFQTVS